MYLKQKGFTLIELLLGLTISLILLGVSFSVFTSNTVFSSHALQRAELNSELLRLKSIIEPEIKRAGFCYDCMSANPFRISDSLGNKTNILIDESASATSGTCIRFAYNHDKAEGINAARKDDVKGFRLGSDSKGKPVLEMYENHKGVANWNCDNTHWRDMHLSSVQISNFTVNRSALSIVGGNTVQSIDVSIDAYLSDDKSVTESINFSITLPNVES